MLQSAYRIAKMKVPRSLEEALNKWRTNRTALRYAALKVAVLNLWTELRIFQTYRRSARRFKMLQGRRGLKIHLGCGDDIRPGWINIDLSLKKNDTYRSDAIFISHDLRTGLPLEEQSCHYIY